MKAKFFPYAVWLLTFLIPVSFVFVGYRVFSGGAPVYPQEIVIALLAVTVLAGLGGKVLKELRPLPRSLALFFLLLLLGLTIGAVVAPNLNDALGAIKSWFLFPIIAGLAVVAGRDVLGKIRLLHPLVLGIFAFAVIETLYGFWAVLSGGGRLAGTFISPNMFAEAVVPIALIALYYSSKYRWLWILTIFLLAGVLFSQSIGGIVSLVAAGLWLLFSVQSRPNKIVLGGVVVIALVGAIAGYSRFSGDKANSLDSRKEIYTVANALAVTNPVIGTGLRGFDERYKEELGEHFDEPLEWDVPEPHNLFLAFWLDTSILGLVAMAGFVGVALRSGVRHPSDFALVAVLVHGLVDTPFFHIVLAPLLWIYVTMSVMERMEQR